MKRYYLFFATLHDRARLYCASDKPTNKQLSGDLPRNTWNCADRGWVLLPWRPRAIMHRGRGFYSCPPRAWGRKKNATYRFVLFKYVTIGLGIAPRAFSRNVMFFKRHYVKLWKEFFILNHATVGPYQKTRVKIYKKAFYMLKAISERLSNNLQLRKTNQNMNLKDCNVANRLISKHV